MNHGASAYRNHKCRCDVCREGHRLKSREEALKRVERIPDHVHGTMNGYNNYSCRCAACSAAQSKHRRER